MKEEKLINRKDSLAKKKERLEKQEKILREKEKKYKTSKLIKLGSLFEKAELENLELEALLGALLEIKQEASQFHVKERWISEGKKLLFQKEGSLQKLIIKFEVEINQDLKSLLKDRRFKFNFFRKEWHGYGNKQDIEQLLNGTASTIELAPL